MKLKLLFPGVAEDFSDAFNNAVAAGVMDRDSSSRMFFAKFELIASDVDDDEVVRADWFLNSLSNVFIRVPRKEITT